MPQLAESRFETGAPEWWLTRLCRLLDARRPQLERHERYYDGRHALAFASEKFRKAFGRLFDEFADNWCEIVVDAVEERLNVEGFRFGPDAAADQDAWRIWQDNQLDADSQIAHTEALLHGEAYTLVWWDPASDRRPLITVEHPSQTIVAHEPGSRRRRVAALKKWRDDSGYLLATLYLPDAIYKYRSDTKRSEDLTSLSSYRWTPREVDDEPWPLENPLEVVPVVPLVNRPRMLQPGRSEIARVIPLQDAVNKTLADLLVASEFTSFRQRWVTGMEIPRDPETNQPIEPFKAAVDRLFVSENPDTKFGEFTETNLGGYVQVIEMLVQHIASQTRTPPHYFYLRGQFPSGESIKSAETGLVAKARRKTRHFGEGWEETMRLAFLVAGNKRSAGEVAVETIWGDPESRTEGEHIDAVLKRKALEVPLPQLWEDVGYTPTQIARFEKMLATGSPVTEPSSDPAEQA
jgi:hypothetical protein